MLRRVCVAQIQLRKHELLTDRSDHPAFIQKHGLQAMQVIYTRDLSSLKDRSSTDHQKIINISSTGINLIFPSYGVFEARFETRLHETRRFRDEIMRGETFSRRNVTRKRPWRRMAARNEAFRDEIVSETKHYENATLLGRG